MADQDDLFADFDNQQLSSTSDNFELASAEWLLGLMDLPKIGAKKALTLARHFQTLENLRSATAEDLYSVVKVRDLEIRDLAPRSPGSEEGVQVLTIFSESYPKGFRDLPDAPPVIWLRGELPEMPMTAIVGTRHPSAWGSGLARHIGYQSAEAGIAVVSGLALGIDTQAHEGALEAGGITIAVLACDVRKPSPAGNVKLAERIIASGGALISEVPFGTTTEPRTLVARNRLQAALANTLTMVECGVPSGTLHTVRHAFELGRPVAVCVPHPSEFSAAESEGNRRLSDSGVSDVSFLSKEAKFENVMSNKKPLADFLLSGEDSLNQFLRGHFGVER